MSCRQKRALSILFSDQEDLTFILLLSAGVVVELKTLLVISLSGVAELYLEVIETHFSLRAVESVIS